MRVLFIFSICDFITPEKPLQVQEQMQFGISYISSLLKSKGHTTDLLILTHETKKKVIFETIREFKPKLICFTSVASEYEFIKDTAKAIKRAFPRIYLLAGGPHISLNPEIAIRDDFDAICIGEGEYPALELVQQLEKGGVPAKISNLWIKTKGNIEKNPTRDFVQELDSLPFPDRKIWQRWIEDTNTRHAIILGRGCPFQCSYCSNHALKKLATGKYVRFRSADNVVDELKQLLKDFPSIEEIYFEVETIGANNDFALDLCRKLEQFNKDQKKLSYGVNLRIIPGAKYDELFKAFKKANFKFINVGIESGSQKIREKMLRRFYSNKDIIQAVRLAKKYGLKVYTYIIVGLPGESLKDFQESIRCCRLCQPDGLLYGIFFPYPGTDIYQYCKDNNLLPKKIDNRLERSKAVLDLPGFPRREIQKQNDWFFYNVYKGYRPLHVTLGHVVYRKLRSNYLLNKIFRKASRNALVKRLLNRVKKASY